MYVTANPRRRGQALGFFSITDAAKVVGGIVGGGAGARRATRLSKDIAEARARMAGGSDGPDADYLRAVAAANGNLTRYEYDNKRREAGDVNLYPLRPTAPAGPLGPVTQVVGAVPGGWLTLAAVGLGAAFLFMGRRRR